MLKSIGYLELMAYFNIDTLREAILMSVPGPTTGLLFFASPRQLLHALPYLLHPCSRKKSRQKKGNPDAALILRSVVFVGGRQKGLRATWMWRMWKMQEQFSTCPFADVRHPWRTPDGLFPTKTTVLGAAKRD